MCSAGAEREIQRRCRGGTVVAAAEAHAVWRVELVTHIKDDSGSRLDEARRRRRIRDRTGHEDGRIGLDREPARLDREQVEANASVRLAADRLDRARREPIAVQGEPGRSPLLAMASAPASREGG